jgi:hypothetical protein
MKVCLFNNLLKLKIMKMKLILFYEFIGMINDKSPPYSVLKYNRI